MEKNKQLEIINNECPLYKNGTSKRELRHDFFKKISTELQAYLLGFHAADGSINLERHTLRIKLTKSDSEIIDLYREYISPEAYTRDVDGFSGVIREKEVVTKVAHEINISSKILVEDIIKWGFGPRKTYNELHLPNINNDLMRHFIRGYFDGDGSIIGGVRKPNPKNREINYRVTRAFNIDSKKISILNEIQEFFNTVSINTNITYIKRDDMYRLCTSATDNITNLFHLLYDDSNFYLTRKFDKFNYYVNTEVSQIITDHCNA